MSIEQLVLVAPKQRRNRKSEPLPTRILRSIVPDTATGCWVWKYRTDRDGYGRIAVRQGVREEAHRTAFETFVGPIPDGLQLDHLCHNTDADCPGGRRCGHRRCVNPAHLEPVTALTNSQRRDRRTALRGHW